MKYRIMIVVAVAALAALGAAAKASAAPSLTTYLDSITCATSAGSVLSAEATEGEGCEFVTSDQVPFAVPICISGTTYSYLDDLAAVQEEEIFSYPAADFVADLNSVYGSVASVGACAKGPAVQPPPGIFLCYSVFQSVPGVWSKEIAAQLLKQGYWMPYAVPGDVAGGTNLGGFHLSCNLAASQSVGDQFVGGDGTVLPAAYNGVPGLYPKVG